MRNCEFCGAENGDVAKHCVSCNEPLTAEVAREDEKVVEKQQRSRLIKAELLYGAGALVLVGLIAWGVMRSRSQAEVKKTVRTFYTGFLAVDNEHVPPFWRCMTRVDIAPKDNIELEVQLDKAIVKSGGKYGKHARERCLPLLEKAPQKLGDVGAPPMMAEAYLAYIDAVSVLKKDADAYVTAIETAESGRGGEEAIKKLASNYHYAGAESVETWAYDKFLRCTVPALGTMKDMQDILTYLGEVVLKDPVPHVQRWKKDCYPIALKTEGATADADYKAKVEAFSSDDRDIQAFQDAIKAAWDKERKASHTPFTQAWYKFSESRATYMGKFAEFLGS